MSEFIQQVINGLSLGSIYALIALGYTMVYGILKLINFAHGEVFMVGAMMAFYVANALAATTLWTSSPVVSLLIVLVAAMATSTSVAVIVERILPTVTEWLSKTPGRAQATEG